MPFLCAEKSISLVVWSQWVSEAKPLYHSGFNQIQWFTLVDLFPKSGFLNPISTICVKRLTSNSSGLLTLRDFSLNWVSVFTAQWFELGVLRYQPLNWALGAVKKFLGLISFYPLGNLSQFHGNLALSS